MKLYSPSTIRAVKKKYGFRFSKSLGQNFITDGRVIDEIVAGAGIEKDDLVIEIGPGIGTLTAAAAEAAAAVIAVELDSRLMPVLEETLRGRDNVRVINGDVLKTDLNGIIEDEREKGSFPGSVRIIGNLPYYITTPIIMGLLERDVGADSITVMMQKEVADRIKAGPGSRVYGAISVAVQYYCQVDHVTDVPPDVFMPRPKVGSSVLNLRIRKTREVEVEDRDVFFSMVRSGFGQRRKTLLNSLTGACGLDRSQVRDILGRSGVDPSRRAETLSIREFADIAGEAARSGYIKEQQDGDKRILQKTS